MKISTPVLYLILICTLALNSVQAATGNGNQPETTAVETEEKTETKETTSTTTEAGISAAGTDLFKSSADFPTSSVKVNAIGIRLGYSSGIWYRRLLPMNNSLDVLLSGRNSGLQLTALYGTQRPFLFSHLPDLFWYTGIGGHIGYNRYYRPGNISIDTVVNWPNGQNYVFINDDRRSTSVSIGFDAMLGFSYQPTELPFTVGMELKPFLDFFDREKFMRLHLDYGFMVAYTF